jgi:hypothetical protein
MEKDREILRLKYENQLVHHEKNIRTLNESIATAQSDNKKFKKWLLQLSKSSTQNAQTIQSDKIEVETVEQSIQTVDDNYKDENLKSQTCQTDEEKSIFKKKDDQILSLRKQLEYGQQSLIENQEIMRHLRKIKLELEYGVGNSKLKITKIKLDFRQILQRVQKTADSRGFTRKQTSRNPK